VRSVAYICSWRIRDAFSAASMNDMAMEYASWPVEAESPDAKRLVTSLSQQRRPDLAPENVERVRIAKKARHADEHVGVRTAEAVSIETMRSTSAANRQTFAMNSGAARSIVVLSVCLLCPANLLRDPLRWLSAMAMDRSVPWRTMRVSGSGAAST
jgi:hypothetical protein